MRTGKENQETKQAECAVNTEGPKHADQKTKNSQQKIPLPQPRKAVAVQRRREQRQPLVLQQPRQVQLERAELEAG